MPRVCPANVTAFCASSSSKRSTGVTGSIAAIGRRVIVHRWTATTSTSPRFAQSVRRLSPEKTNRSCPLSALAGDGGSASAIVYQPVAGSTGRNRRWSFTNSCEKFHAPAFTSGSTAVQRGCSCGDSCDTVHPVMIRPPLNSGRAPSAARITVGDPAVPESSEVITSVAASSYRPSATSTTNGPGRSGSAARSSRTRSRARRSVATGAVADPSCWSFPAGATVTSATLVQPRSRQCSCATRPMKWSIAKGPAAWSMCRLAWSSAPIASKYSPR